MLCFRVLGQGRGIWKIRHYLFVLLITWVYNFSSLLVILLWLCWLIINDSCEQVTKYCPYTWHICDIYVSHSDIHVYRIGGRGEGCSSEEICVSMACLIDMLWESSHLLIIIFSANKLPWVGYLPCHLLNPQEIPGVLTGLLYPYFLHRLPIAFVFSCWSREKKSQFVKWQKTNQGTKCPFILLAGNWSLSVISL